MKWYKFEFTRLYEYFQIVMLFVNACTWKTSGDTETDTESEEGSTKRISDLSSIIFERTEKNNIF